VTNPGVFTRVSRAKKYSKNTYWSRAALTILAVAGLAALPFYGFAQTDSTSQAPNYLVSSNGAFVVYQGSNGETVCRDATVAEGRALKSSASSTGFH